MLEITMKQIRLHAHPKDKVEAIKMVGQLLVDSGNIAAGYVDSMLGREKVANTYLGNGITIPHGLPENRELIQQTGVAVLQVPDGVTWNPGETARLIVGIAAKSDEHIEVLRKLTGVLGNDALVAKLSQTTDPQDITEALTGARAQVAPATVSPEDYEHYFDAVVHNATGLHARPAAIFVGIAKRFKANIRIRKGDQVSDGKRLLALLQLGANRGAQIRVSAQGVDAEEALAALKEALANNLGDKEPAPATSTKQTQAAQSTTAEQSWTPTSAQATISGISASSGIVIGPVHRYQRAKVQVVDQPEDPVRAGDRLQGAINQAQKDLQAIYQEVKERSGIEQAAIFQAHGEMLDDASLIQQTVALILAGHGAAWSWDNVIQDQVQQLQKLHDPVLAGRATDLQDIGQRVLQHMTAGTTTQAAKVTRSNRDDGATPAANQEPGILLAEDLAPSDTATLDPASVLGFCTASGGPTSHTAIIARSMDIPAIVGAGPEVMNVREGALCILDGQRGKLYVQPDEQDIAYARQLQQQALQQQEAEKAERFATVKTIDQHEIEVVANIGNVDDARRALAAGAEGIGLMRTEFLFLARDTAPDEEEQFRAYRDIVQCMEGKPVIIRTLDIGGDKEVPYLNLPKEDNPFLGIRGVRLCFAHPELFKGQLRAIYRAAAYGPISIMFPMIATLEDFEKARAYAEQVRQELNAPQIPLGIMVEVPSAALLADQFAREVAFFSVGTNDLTQYVLAMDRGHPELAKQADALHPAVLRSIAQTVQAAQKAGKWVGVCGNLATDPLGAEILTGLGVTELSVSIPAVPNIKAHMRATRYAALQDKAQQALACRTAAEVRSL
jgi:Phosphotransferase System HPr (HPr) Family